MFVVVSCLLVADLVGVVVCCSLPLFGRSSFLSVVCGVMTLVDGC